MVTSQRILGRRVKVYMGIPSMGERSDFQCTMLRKIAQRYEKYVELVYPTQTVYRIFHDHARNGIVEDFLASDCDVLWFLDNDIGPAKHVLDLVVNHWDKWEASGAPYPIWCTPPGGGFQQILFTAYEGFGDSEHGNTGIRMTDVPSLGMKWVDGLATGCLFLKRSVFEGMAKPYFEFKYDHDTRNIVEGEDLGFCLKLAKKGIRFLTDFSMVCKHFKRVDLLDMNNYTIDFSNQRVEAYDAQIRRDVEPVIKSAYEKGFKDCAARMGREVELNTSVLSTERGPKRTASGLILPNG